MKNIQTIGLLLGMIAVLNACTQPPELPLSVARGGTYNYQVQPGTNTAKLGTTILLKLRESDGSKIRNSAQIKVIGPATWNGDKPVSFVYPTNADWALSPQTDVPPVKGTYQIQILMVNRNNEKVEATDSFSIQDAALVLEFPTISVTEATRATVVGNWTAVAGSNGYFTHLFNGTDGVNESKTAYLKELSVKFPENASETIALNPSKFNLMVVYSANFDTTKENPELSDQINISDAASFLTLDLQKSKRQINSKIRNLSKITIFK
jgi:hypothetical protein